MISLAGLILSPALLWGWIFYHSHRYKQSHLPLLALLFLGGFGAGMLALVLNHSVEKYTVFWPGAQQPIEEILGLAIAVHSAGFWLMVGVNEECAKLAVLLLAVYPSRHLEEPFDGILYAAVIALGFATVENAVYLEQYGTTVVISRSLITLPAHAFMSVPLGYFTAKSKLSLMGRGKTPNAYHVPMLLILAGWCYSAMLHGFYDLFLALNLDHFSYALVVLMMLQGIWFGKKSLKQSKLAPFQAGKDKAAAEPTTGPS